MHIDQRSTSIQLKPLLTALATIFIYTSLISQSVTHWGTEFWGPSASGFYEIETSDNSGPITVNLERLADGVTDTYVYQPNSVNHLDWFFSNNFYESSVYITSDAPIHVKYHMGIHSGGGTMNIIPVDYMGTYYTISTNHIQQYANTAGFEPRVPHIYIRAFEDNTEIMFKTTHVAESGVPPNAYTTIQLNRGETYAIEGIFCSPNLSPPNDCYVNGELVSNDFSGTIIYSKGTDCSPFQVELHYGGTFAPYPEYPASNPCCSDLDTEQLLPDKYWGKKFHFINELHLPHGNYLMLYSKFNDNEIRFNDQYITTLNEGETLDTLLFEPLEIVTSKPSYLNHYFLSWAAEPAWQSPGVGYETDPEIFYLMPTKYRSTRGLLKFTYNTYTYETSPQSKAYLVLSVENSNIANIRFDGTPIDPNLFTPFHASSDYSYAYFSIPDPLLEHEVTCTSGDFQGMVYANCSQGSRALRIGLKETPDDFSMEIINHSDCFADYPQELTASSTGVTRFKWDSGETTPSITIHGEGIYTVYGFDECDDTLFIEKYTVSCPKPCESQEFKPVNVFSPNGDNLNERFLFDLPECAVVNQLNITNRWGNIVYNAQDNSGWDGTFNGNNCSEGVYFWELQYTVNEELFTVQGFVNLLR